MEFRDELIQQKEENKHFLDILQQTRQSPQKTIHLSDKYRVLPLKQLKDTLQEIQNSKQKYDQKKIQLHLPSETLEQHMYTFLQKKYGLKHLVVENAGSIIQSIGQYSKEDIEVHIFGKILKNQIDEEFRYVVQQVRASIQQIIKQHYKKKFVFKSAGEIQKLVDLKIRSNISIDECEEIINFMYNDMDAIKLSERLNNNDHQININDEHMTRLELIQAQQKVEKQQKQIEFQQFERIILEFLLQQHENFLKNLIHYFQQVDKDQDGVINDSEFAYFFDLIPMEKDSGLVQRFLQIIDPLNMQIIDFSGLVNLLSNQHIQNYGRKVSYLQYISELS